MTDAGLLIAQVDVVKWLEDPSKLTLFVFTLLLLIAGKMRWWVFGWVYDQRVIECEKSVADANAQRDKWQDVALRAVRVGSKLVDNGSPS